MNSIYLFGFLFGFIMSFFLGVYLLNVARGEEDELGTRDNKIKGRRHED